MEEPVEYEVRVVSNFLTKGRFSYALPLALAMLTLSLVLSNIYWHSEFELSGYLKATPSLVFKKAEYWRLFTSSLIHGDLAHFLSNSLMLAIMSYFVISYYGYLIYPVLSLLMGAVINYLVLLSHNNNTGIVGASGIVYYLWGFWLILYFLIQRHVSLNRRLMKIVAITIIILVPTHYKPNVSYLAHGIGLLLGIFTGVFYFLFNKKFIFSQEEKVIIDLSAEDP